MSISSYYLRASPRFILAALGVVIGLIVIYIFVHWLVSNHMPNLHPILGAVLANVPLLVVYLVGGSGGFIFGAGEGRLGALTFLGVSLVLAAVRGDYGCEVMSIPGIIFGKHTQLTCVVFSPVDWLERNIAKKG